MKFPEPLQPSKLLKRYKRFLADVEHPELGEITVHCPNTGSMKNCWEEGWTAWLLDSHNPKRKYQYTWVLSESPGGEVIGINTHFANDVVYEAIEMGAIEELNEFQQLQKEVKYGEENSRIDILLSDANGKKTYVEVKSVTLLDQGQGYFPDAVSTRGQKHLRELMACVEAGHRAVLFFLVQHSGIESVKAASHIDAKYAELLTQALSQGVEILVYATQLDQNGINIDRQLEFLES